MQVTVKISAMIIQRMPCHGRAGTSRSTVKPWTSRSISACCSMAVLVCYLLWVITITYQSALRGVCPRYAAAVACLGLGLSCATAVHAQAANESLGPADSHGKVKGTPLVAEMKTLRSS